MILFDLKKTYKFKLTVNHSPIIEDGNSCIIVDDINMSMGMDRAVSHMCAVCGVWCVVCGVWSGVWCVVCDLWSGVWCG